MEMRGPRPSCDYKFVVIHAFHHVGRVWEISMNYPPQFAEGPMDLETTIFKQDMGSTGKGSIIEEGKGSTIEEAF
jgi:hypothetical protein